MYIVAFIITKICHHVDIIMYIFQGNTSANKDIPCGEGIFKFGQSSVALSHPHHRPCSLPVSSLPHSPLTQQQQHQHHPSPSSTTSEDPRTLTKSLSYGSPGNLIKQINFPLVRDPHV